MAQSTRETEPVSDDVLSDWKRVASGGFGCVYKATHKQWQFDVAVKIPHKDVDLSLPIEEARLMDVASCEYVLRVHGRYVGRPPGLQYTTEGLVMEFMEMGCLGSLMRKLSGPIPGPLLPWPLAFRCAHEVALGMNFLHSKGIVHNDLKLSNVLLNEDLHVKIADFGLSRVPKSVLHNTEDTKVIGGTYKYMPPEAFDLSYEPSRRHDVYSYGILLWALFSGKEPYLNAPTSLVILKVPTGQRPKCDHLEQIQVEGLKELVNLMERCWEQIPDDRPTFIDCLKDTKPVWLKHQEKIPNAVQEVKRRLESATSSQHSGTNEKSVSSPQTRPVTESFSPVGESVHPESHDEMDNRLPQQQNYVDLSPVQRSDEDKAKFIDDNMTYFIRGVKEVMAVVDELGALVHHETYNAILAKTSPWEQMRLIYRKVLPPGGVRAKIALYNAIAKHHPLLMSN
ncbi:uncharacterized protein V6R79_020302 [Siganus canaliculatus]